MFREKVAPAALPRPTCSALRRPRRVFVLLGLLILPLIFASGCGRSQSAAAETQDDYQVAFATDPAPPDQGAGTVIVNVKDRHGRGVEGAHVAVEANMNHAGMKPENAEASTGANGEYRLPLNWTMGGAWYVDVKITLASGEVIRRQFPVDVK